MWKRVKLERMWRNSYLVMFKFAMSDDNGMYV